MGNPNSGAHFEIGSTPYTPEVVMLRQGGKWEKGKVNVGFQLLFLTMVLSGTVLAACSPYASEVIRDTVDDLDSPDDVGGDDGIGGGEFPIPKMTATPEVGDVGRDPGVQTFISNELRVGVGHYFNVNTAGEITGLYGQSVMNNAEVNIESGDDGTITVTMSGNDLGSEDDYIRGQDGYSAQEKLGSGEMQEWLGAMDPSEANQATVAEMQKLLSENPELASVVTMETDYNLDQSGTQLVDMGLKLTITIGERVFVLESTLDPLTDTDVFKGLQIASIVRDPDAVPDGDQVRFDLVPDTWVEMDGVHVSPEFATLSESIESSGYTLSAVDGVVEHNGEPVPNVFVTADGQLIVMVGDVAKSIDSEYAHFAADGLEIDGLELDDNGEWVEAVVGEQVTIGGVTLTLDENGVVTSMEPTGASQDIKDDNMEKFDPSNYGLSNASIEKDESGIHVVVDGENVAKWAGTEWEWDWQAMEGLEGGNPLFDFAKTYPTDSNGSVRQTSEVRADAGEVQTFAEQVAISIPGSQHDYTVYLYSGEGKVEAVIARVITNGNVLDPNKDIGGIVDGWVCFKAESGMMVRMKINNVEVAIRRFN